MIHVLSVLHYPVFGGPHNRNAIISSILKGQGIDTTLVLPSDAIEAQTRIHAVGGKTMLMPLSRLRKTSSPSEHFRYMCSLSSNIKMLRQVIRDLGIDVVVINGLINPHAAIAAKREGIPVVWQILDCSSPLYVRHLFRLILHRYADVIMCVGNRVAKLHFVLESKNKPVMLFNPPVDLARFNPDVELRMHMRDELGISDDDFVIGNVSNVNPEKDHMTFVRAAALIKRDRPNARFVILGQTYPNHAKYAHRLSEEAVRLGLEPGKDFRILDPGNRVAELAQAFDVFWLTSQSEGISTAAEEAMALGVPVISTDVGSMSEIIRDGDTGFLVAPRDIDAFARQTIRLASDQALRMRMGESARQFATAHFGTERCASCHLLAYRTALGDPQAFDGQW